jgi:type I restriction enzyme S subunit
MKETPDLEAVNSEIVVSSDIQNVHKHKIPKGWQVKSLRQLTEKVGSGITPRGGEKLYKQSGRPFLRSQNVGWGSLILDDIVYIDEETHLSFGSTEIKEGDVFLNITGASIGRSAIANKFVLGGNVNQHVCIIRTKIRLLDPKYLNSFLLSTLGQNSISSFQAGGNRQGLNFEQIKGFKLPLPPLPEQRIISSFLSNWDEAIQTATQLIAQKELSKKWLMQNLLTGKRRLKGLNGEWKRIGAGEVFKSNTVKGFASEELLSVTQDRGVVPRSMSAARVTMPSGETTGFKLVEAGDFVISLRSFQGGLEYSYCRGIVSPAYTVLKPRMKINDEFYKQYFKSYDFIGHLAVAVIGIRDGKQISYEDFCFVKIPYPSFEEQTAIAEILQTADNELQLLKNKLEMLKEQKKGLMQLLLTGKKRLKIE